MLHETSACGVYISLVWGAHLNSSVVYRSASSHAAEQSEETSSSRVAEWYEDPPTLPPTNQPGKQPFNRSRDHCHCVTKHDNV